jgi:hypothetical protein
MILATSALPAVRSKDGGAPPSFRVSKSAVLARPSEGESGAELNDAAGNRGAADYSHTRSGPVRINGVARIFEAGMVQYIDSIHP